MDPIIQSFFDRATATVTHLVHDPETGDAAIIDPVLDYDPATQKIHDTSARTHLAAAKTLNLRYILETHVHADHLSAAQIIRRETGAKIVIGAGISEVRQHFAPLYALEDTQPFDLLAEDAATLPLGTLEIHVMATPGHTPACVTYRIGNAAFVGDTLFMPDFGTARADFPGGNACTLYRSIQKILALPPATRIFVGHDYLPKTRTHFAWETTVAAQRAGNIHVHDGVTEAAFTTLRHARDATLSPPALLHQSLQVNLQAGQIPESFPKETKN